MEDVTPHAHFIFFRLPACLPDALQPGHSVRSERDRENDPRRRAARHSVSFLELCDGQGDGQATANKKRRDSRHESPKESLAPMAAGVRLICRCALTV